MNYPLISEYVEAIKSAEDNFEELSYLRPVFGDDGLPVMTSGNFAVVFKMRDERDGKLYALKCFTKEQEGRTEAYREIAKELKDVSSPYLVAIQFLEKELFVDTDQTTETEFPVLLMDWVEGKTLDKYLRENLDDKYALEMLAYRFSLLAQWLIPQPFAHGDLKPDNILVRDDGKLVLVDYDGMYVPAMKGQKARELGSPDFRHPLRTEYDFDEHIDDFPIASILLSLKVISISPLLLEEFGGHCSLLMTEKDYLNISDSRLIKTLQYMLSIKELSLTYSIFINTITHFRTNNGIQSLIMKLHYDNSFFDLFSQTIVCENENYVRIEDEKGVSYSEDGIKLIKGCSLYDPYVIHSGCEVICDKAFSGEYYYDGSGKNYINEIVIPRSVKYIGKNPFAFCSVDLICNSPYYIVEDEVLYTYNKKLLIGYYGDCNVDSINIPEGVQRIGDYAFAGVWWIKKIELPSTIECIGDYAFQGCQYLERIELNACLKHIGKRAFMDCEKLRHVELPNGLISIGSYAFSYCTSIPSITIPSTVISIGFNPFLYNRFLDLHCNSYMFVIDNKTLYTKDKKYIISCLSQDLFYQIPTEVSHIGPHAFCGCPFKGLFIHDNINYIGDNAFDGCYYEAYPNGYSIKLLVSKGRGDWLRKRVLKRIDIIELETQLSHAFAADDLPQPPPILK